MNDSHDPQFAASKDVAGGLAAQSPGGAPVRPLRIAFVSQFDPDDIRAWSGIVHHMMRALGRQPGVSVFPVGPLAMPRPVFCRLKHAFYKLVMRKSYAMDRELAVLEAFARQIEERLAGRDVDVVFSPSSIPLALVRSDRPLALWADATFEAYWKLYAPNLCRESIRKGLAQERLTLSRSALAVYSSEWAARSARESDAIAASKVHVAPFGANIDITHNADDVRRMVDARPRDSCRMLFIGVDWRRKGGALAVEVAAQLNAAGIKTTLDVVGCAPGEPLPSFVRVHGFVSKLDPVGRQRINELLAGSHFLMLPSRAEAYGIVFAEANAFGVPCLATDVGGITSAVSDGVNGLLFPLDAPPADWVKRIAPLFGDAMRYREMAMRSFEHYATRLNWDVGARQVIELIRQAAQSPAPAAVVR